MGIDYAAEKFCSAMDYAIASTESLQNRLAGVMLGVCHLDRNDFADDETWERFERLMKETTKRTAHGNEGNIRATTSQMSDDEAAKLLREALALFSKVSEQYGEQGPKIGE